MAAVAVQGRLVGVWDFVGLGGCRCNRHCGGLADRYFGSSDGTAEVLSIGVVTGVAGSAEFMPIRFLNGW